MAGYSKSRSWQNDVKKAYSAGYNAGYHSAKNVPDKFGARHSATVGYYVGLTNVKKREKYDTQDKKHVRK